MRGSAFCPATLLTLVFTTSAHRSKLFERVEGKPAVLVVRGRLAEEALHKERVNPGEIFEEMRAAGLEWLEQVKWAILESDGRVSVIPEDEQGERQTPQQGEVSL